MRSLASGLAIAALGAGCGAGPAAGDAAPSVDAAGPEHALGMSDISILLPLPTDATVPVLTTLAGSGAPLVNEAMFASLVLTGNDIAPKNNLPFGFADMQVVGIRFDLCDRSTVGACPAGSDGRLRLVLQPMYTQHGTVFAHDIAIHCFYAIPAAELGGTVSELRALAALQDAPVDAPLAVSPAVSAGNTMYVDRLRRLVLTYARADNLRRMTVIGQEENSGAVAWIFRGFDKPATTNPYDYTSMLVPQVNGTQQTVLTAGGDVTYVTNPLADLPSGLSLALNGSSYDLGTLAAQTAALTALEEVQNPELHDAVDLQCAACHVSTYLTRLRSDHLGIDPTTLPTAYRSTHDTTVDNVLTATDPRVIRAFGWVTTSPAISQRVANDTAHTLTELDARFPARP